MAAIPPLTELEIEILENCSMSGETTTTLEEELLEAPMERAALERTLRDLVRRGLLTTCRGTFSGVRRPRGGRSFSDTYEDDWWDVTSEGGAALAEAGV